VGFRWVVARLDKYNKVRAHATDLDAQPRSTSTAVKQWHRRPRPGRMTGQAG